MTRARDYRFDRLEDVARYRADMKGALRRLDINCPYGRPLIPIPELNDWHSRALVQYELPPEGNQNAVEVTRKEATHHVERRAECRDRGERRQGNDNR